MDRDRPNRGGCGREGFSLPLWTHNSDGLSMKDPELQNAVESFLHWAGDLTRCPACHKIRSQGHTANCRLNAMNVVLNSRVERIPQGLAEQIAYSQRQIESWPDSVRVAMGLPAVETSPRHMTEPERTAMNRAAGGSVEVVDPGIDVRSEKASAEPCICVIPRCGRAGAVEMDNGKWLCQDCVRRIALECAQASAVVRNK